MLELTAGQSSILSSDSTPNMTRMLCFAECLVALKSGTPMSQWSGVIMVAWMYCVRLRARLMLSCVCNALQVRS